MVHGVNPFFLKRSALLTARYPIHTGLQTNVIAVAQPSGLHRNETLFPQGIVRKLNNIKSTFLYEVTFKII